MPALPLYAALLRTRLIDEALARLVRTGAISKAWLGTGEEAVTVGAVHALRRPRGAPGLPDADAAEAPDVVAPMIRNSGACTEMGMPVAGVLRAYLGTADAPSRGRDGHYGDLARGILPPISHVGDVVPVTTGIALSFKRRGEPRVALTWIGDGASKTGTAHEGLNLAAVLRVPAIFVLQHNQVSLGTRDAAFHRPARTGRGFDDLPAAYGMPGVTVDGNDVVAVRDAVANAAARCRAGDGPAMVVARTFRAGSHATHDAREAERTFTPAERATWAARDPLALARAALVARGVADDEIARLERAVADEVARGEGEALESRATRMPRGEDALAGVHAIP